MTACKRIMEKRCYTYVTILFVKRNLMTSGTPVVLIGITSYCQKKKKKKIRHILQDTLKKKYNIKGALSPSLTWHIRTECCSKRSQKMERSRPCSIETQMDIGQHK